MPEKNEILELLRWLGDLKEMNKRFTAIEQSLNNVRTMANHNRLFIKELEKKSGSSGLDPEFFDELRRRYKEQDELCIRMERVEKDCHTLKRKKAHMRLNDTKFSNVDVSLFLTKFGNRFSYDMDRTVLYSILNSLDTLDPKDLFIIKKRIETPTPSFESIGREMNLSKTRISTRLQKALQDIKRFYQDILKAPIENESLAGRPIEDLGFNIRTNNCLLAAKIKTIDDLISKSENDLYKIPTFGKKSLVEVKEVLKLKGLSLSHSNG